MDLDRDLDRMVRGSLRIRKLQATVIVAMLASLQRSLGQPGPRRILMAIVDPKRWTTQATSCEAHHSAIAGDTSRFDHLSEAR